MTSPNSLARNRRQRKTLLLVLGLLVLLVVQLLAYQLWLSYREEIHDAETRTRSYAAIFETRLDATLRRTDAILQGMTRHIPARALSRQASSAYIGEMTSELDSQLLNFSELVGLRVFDVEGELLYSSDWANTPRINVADRPYFRALQDKPQNGLVFSEVIVSRATDRPSLIVASPLRDADGVFRGIVTAVLNLDLYAEIFRSVTSEAMGSSPFAAATTTGKWYAGRRYPPRQTRRSIRTIPFGNPSRAETPPAPCISSRRLTAPTAFTVSTGSNAIPSISLSVSVAMSCWPVGGHVPWWWGFQGCCC